MKFSIRNVAIWFLLLALLLSAFTAFARNNSLERENATLLETLGFAAGSTTGNFRLYTLDQRNPDTGDHLGPHLLRINGFEEYDLEATSYSTESGKRETKLIDIGDPLVSITCHHARGGLKRFLINSTYHVNQLTNGEFSTTQVDGYSFSPFTHGGECDGRIILTYLFFPKTTNRPSAANLTNTQNAEKLIELCDLHKVNAVFFRIVKRDAG